MSQRGRGGDFEAANPPDLPPAHSKINPLKPLELQPQHCMGTCMTLLERQMGTVRRWAVSWGSPQHPAQPRYTNFWAPRTRKQHRKDRSRRQNALPRRGTRREERVTVHGPVNALQPDGMSQGGGGGLLLAQFRDDVLLGAAGPFPEREGLCVCDTLSSVLGATSPLSMHHGNTSALQNAVHVTIRIGPGPEHQHQESIPTPPLCPPGVSAMAGL